MEKRSDIIFLSKEERQRTGGMGSSSLHVYPSIGKSSKMLYKSYSGLTGLPTISVRETNVDKTTGLPIGGTLPRKDGVSREERLNNELIRDVSFLETRHIEKIGSQHSEWKLFVDTKWASLYVLQNFKSDEKRRRAKPLDSVYESMTQEYEIDNQLYVRIFMSNYQFDNIECEECLNALKVVFRCLDENFDKRVDWRAFIANLRVLEAPKQSVRVRFNSLFDIIASFGTTITMVQLWQIVRLPALFQERKKLFEIFLQRCALCVSPPLGFSWKYLSADAVKAFDQLVNGTSKDSRDMIVGTPSRSQSIEEIQSVTISKSLYTRILFENVDNKANALEEILEQMCWNRQPEHVKMTTYMKTEELSSDKFHGINTKIQWMEARLWWQRMVRPKALAYRFALWKRNARKQKMMRIGMEHHRRKQLQNAVDNLNFFTETRYLYRWRNVVAEHFAKQFYMRRALHKWTTYYYGIREIADAHRGWRLQRVTFVKWRLAVHITIRFRIMFKQSMSNLLADRFADWKEWLDLLKEKRKNDEVQAEVRKAMFEKQMQDADEVVAGMEADEKARQDRIAAQKEQESFKEAVWNDQRENAYARMEDRRKIRNQESQRLAHKKRLHEQEARAFVTMWADIEKKAMDDARREAEAYLKTTAGEKELNVLAESVKNDVANMQMSGNAGAKGDEAAAWVKMYDKEFDMYFFYNEATGDKMDAVGLSTRECVKIAREEYIAKQVAKAKDEIARVKKREDHKAKLVKVARKIQAAWKILMARRRVFAIIKEQFVKRVDPHSGMSYYYDMLHRKAQWEKLRILHTKDLRDMEWAIRCREDNSVYYENRVSPWLTSDTKPAGFLQCLVCWLQLSMVRCDDCQMYYCLDCFEASHPLKSEVLATHVIHKTPYDELIKAVPEKCIMCKVNVAGCFCIECSFTEFLCKPCYNLSHLPDPRRPNRRTAKQMHQQAIEF